MSKNKKNKIPLTKEEKRQRNKTLLITLGVMFVVIIVLATPLGLMEVSGLMTRK